MIRLTAVLSGRPTAERKARDELHAAIEGKRAAEAELQAKTQAIQRLRQVVQAADAAEWAAGQAEAAATAGATAWAEAGAADGDIGHQSLIDQAIASRRQASVARIRAAGALKALPAAEAAVEGARRDCDQAAEKIRAAVGGVLAALVQPAFAKAAQARRHYLEAINQIRGALDTEDLPGWHGPYRRNLTSGLSSLRDKINEFSVPAYAAQGRHTDAPGYDPDQWAELARRLAVDPGAGPADADVS